ncbi:MAG: hypothetical protein SOW80_12030 [Anaerovoracaceae bacterium]|nr:hypothetical protein [Anaerovoracaceae bacterium]
MTRDSGSSPSIRYITEYLPTQSSAHRLALRKKIAACRQSFDALNLSVLTSVLSAQPLREVLDVESIVQDFHMYMDFFNLRYGSAALSSDQTSGELLQKHKERCHRQLSILLHGVLGENREKE